MPFGLLALCIDSVSVCQAQTFAKLLESNASEQSEDKSITAMGILNTLEIICSVLESQAEVHCMCVPSYCTDFVTFLHIYCSA